MGKFSEYIGSQFGYPRGFVGKCCCLLMNLINYAMYRKTVGVVSLTEASTVLDIGYGNGYLISRLYKRYRSDIYGIDISSDMKVNAEKRNYKARQDGKLHLSVGDCCDLKFEDCFFDVVTSINTIYFWKDAGKGLQEIFRTLKLGGVFVNVVYTKKWLQKLSYTRKGFRLFEQEDYLRLGKEAGFSEVKVQDIIRGKNFAVIYRKERTTV